MPLRELGMSDVALVGGKNASLGEMICNLTNAGVNVPDGYATTARAFWRFLEHNQLKERIQNRLAGLNIDNVNQLTQIGAEIRQWIIDAPFQAELEESIINAYQSMSATDESDAPIAVRSSATARTYRRRLLPGNRKPISTCAALIRC